MDKLLLYTQEILELKRNIGNNVWLIGNRLIDIKESKLYLEKYGLWSEYLENEVDISQRSADRFMRIAKEYKSAMVADWGVGKLDLLLSVEDSEREELVKVHSTDSSFSEFRKSVQALKQKEQNPEIEYFAKTEEILKETLIKLIESKDYLTACYLKQTFHNYPRKQIIFQLWEKIQKEVEYNGNIK